MKAAWRALQALGREVRYPGGIANLFGMLVVTAFAASLSSAPGAVSKLLSQFEIDTSVLKTVQGKPPGFADRVTDIFLLVVVAGCWVWCVRTLLAFESGVAKLHRRDASSEEEDDWRNPQSYQ